MKTFRELQTEATKQTKKGVIAKAARKGSPPYTVVVIDRLNKVVKQETTQVADAVPAFVHELQKRYPKGEYKISVEDKGGSRVYSEGIAEGKRMNRLMKDMGIQIDKPGPNNPTDDEIDAMDSFMASKALKGWTKNPDGSQGYPFGHPFQSPKRSVKKLMNTFFKNHGMTGPGKIKIIKTDATPKEKTLLKQLATQLGNGTPREKEMLGKISTILKSKQVDEGVIILPKPSSRGGDVKEVGMDKRGSKTQYWWKHKNGLKNVFDSIEKLRYSLRNDANFKDAEEITKQLGGKKKMIKVKLSKKSADELKKQKPKITDRTPAGY